MQSVALYDLLILYVEDGLVLSHSQRGSCLPRQEEKTPACSFLFQRLKLRAPGRTIGCIQLNRSQRKTRLECKARKSSCDRSLDHTPQALRRLVGFQCAARSKPNTSSSNRR